MNFSHYKETSREITITYLSYRLSAQNLRNRRGSRVDDRDRSRHRDRVRPRLGNVVREAHRAHHLAAEQVVRGRLRDAHLREAEAQFAIEIGGAATVP